MGLPEFLKLDEKKDIANLDDAAVTELHRDIIDRKPFLKKLYADFYRQLQSEAGDRRKTVIELGSGGGFINRIWPQVTTSDVLDVSGADMVFSALDMPFEDESVDAFVMIDVFHHLPDVDKFLTEAQRCLKKGGRIVMIEPANTLWSRFIYTRFHHEDFDAGGGWNLPQGSPLSNANGALPWIVFHRDGEKFRRRYPRLAVVKKRVHTPFLYLLSGGFALIQLVPSFCYPVFKAVEFILTPLNKLIGMFETIVVVKAD